MDKLVSAVRAVAAEAAVLTSTKQAKASRICFIFTAYLLLIISAGIIAGCLFLKSNRNTTDIGGII